ncbi:uncharacterized protein [Typha angustifolia]|uniref:uncharacterized protein n=1 Tax=Typha angustifolia TaxID=59011 RepID=UPI003C2D0F66
MKKGEEERVSHLIDQVKILIEKFLMLYMTKEETIKALLDQDKISPITTEQVWKRLEEENSEFFQHYHARLLLKDNIIAFNDLLRKQANLMAAGGPSSAALMQVSEGHQNINSGGDASVVHGSMDIPTVKWASENSERQMLHDVKGISVVSGLNSQGNPNFLFFQDGDPMRTQAQQTIGDALGASYPPFMEQQYAQQLIDPNQNVASFDVSNQRSAGPDYVLCPTTTSSSIIHRLPQNEQLCLPENKIRPLNRRGMQTSIPQYFQEVERRENSFKLSYPSTSRVAFPNVDNRSKTQSLVEDAPIPSLQCLEPSGTEWHEPNHSVKRLKKPFTRTRKNLPRNPCLSTSRNVSPSPNSTDCAPILSRADQMPSIQNFHNSIVDVQPSRHKNTPSDVGTPPAAMVDTASESLKEGRPNPEHPSNTAVAFNTDTVPPGIHTPNDDPLKKFDTASESLKAGTPDPEHPIYTDITFNTDTDPPGTHTSNDDPLKNFDVDITDLGSPWTFSDLDGMSFDGHFTDDDLSSSILHQASQNGNIVDDSFDEKPI